MSQESVFLDTQHRLVVEQTLFPAIFLKVIIDYSLDEEDNYLILAIDDFLSFIYLEVRGGNCTRTRVLLKRVALFFCQNDALTLVTQKNKFYHLVNTEEFFTDPERYLQQLFYLGSVSSSLEIDNLRVEVSHLERDQEKKMVVSLRYQSGGRVFERKSAIYQQDETIVVHPFFV